MRNRYGSRGRGSGYGRHCRERLQWYRMRAGSWQTYRPQYQTPSLKHYQRATSNSDRDIAAEVLSFYEQRKRERTEGKRLAGIETGITSLDNVLGGLQPGTLTIIGGRSGHGKSTLSLDIFFRAGKADVPSLYVILEQTVRKSSFIFSRSTPAFHH